MKQKNNPSSPSIAYQILEKLWKLNRIFCSSDYDASLEYLSTFLPFAIHQYSSTQPYKGWVIPPKWELIKGEIRCKGRVIYEADHPLKIIGISKSFQGEVSGDELKKHLHYDQRNPNNIPYHFRQHYRPWDRNWGFCVPQTFYDSLNEDIYEVEIITKESEGYLKVAEYIKPGKLQEGFAFVAHLDHPGMANDDLSGVAVGVELLHRLSQIETKFTYRLVLVQEIIGSVFYLDHEFSKGNPILESCFIEMLGSKTPLSFQYSRFGSSCLEKELKNALMKSGQQFTEGPFRSIVCNDECVWESYRIPMCSLSRFPYPEYHSDKDNLSIMSQEYLTDAVDILYDSLIALDKNILLKKQFEGVYSLAHPSFNLYIDPGQPAFNKLPSTSSVKLRSLMDEIPLLPKYSFINSIAEALQLPEDLVFNYLKQWEEKGLIDLM